MSVEAPAPAVSGAVVSYQWQVDGVDVPGATAAGYLVGASELGRVVQVVVTYAAPGYQGAQRTAVAGVVKAGSFRLARPAIKGSPRVGEVVRAVVETDGLPMGARLSYRWFVGGDRVRGADERTLALTPRMVGERVRVQVVAKAAGYDSDQRTSRTTEKVTARRG